jgi:Flp pilus assembly protein TadD
MHSTRNTLPVSHREATVHARPAPDNAAPHLYQQARDAYEAAEYEAAIDLLYPLLKERPLDISVNKLLGYAHFARKEYVLAAGPLSAAMIFAPDEPEPHLVCAQCLAHLGERTLARELAMHALEISREDPAHADVGTRAGHFLVTA